MNRYSYELHYGDFDKKLFVCHHCDNKLCCNPKHLFLGTHTDNMQDMIRKERHKWGINAPHKSVELYHKIKG